MFLLISLIQSTKIDCVGCNNAREKYYDRLCSNFMRVTYVPRLAWRMFRTFNFATGRYPMIDRHITRLVCVIFRSLGHVYVCIGSCLTCSLSKFLAEQFVKCYSLQQSKSRWLIKKKKIDSFDVYRLFKCLGQFCGIINNFFISIYNNM